MNTEALDELVLCMKGLSESWGAMSEAWPSVEVRKKGGISSIACCIV